MTAILEFKYWVGCSIRVSNVQVSIYFAIFILSWL